VLATAAEPVLVIQDQGKVLLVNSGTANTARFAVLLQQQGINHNWAIATNSQFSTSSGWLEILERLPVLYKSCCFRGKYHNQSGNFERSAIASSALVSEHWSNGGQLALQRFN